LQRRASRVRPPGRVPCRRMATLSPHESTLDERTRKAWSAYHEEIVALQGRAYDAAEAESWDRLQELLQDIDADRAALHTGGADDA
jgi:hypothetical protein